MKPRDTWTDEEEEAWIKAHESKDDFDAGLSGSDELLYAVFASCVVLVWALLKFRNRF